MTLPAIKKTVEKPFDEVRAQVTRALADEGFGVLTEIDVQKTMKKKLDVDYERYEILGACNPRLAHKALGTDLDVGVLLPCNVVLYEEAPGRTVVSAIDPMAAIGAFGSGPLEEVATEARQRLGRALDALG